MRADFVERVRKPLISKLLDDLLAHKVLSQGEVDEVQEGYAVTGDKARCLIDAVRLKGSKASQIFIDSLRKHDHALVEQLGLATGSGERRGAVACPSHAEALGASCRVLVGDVGAAGSSQCHCAVAVGPRCHAAMTRLLGGLSPVGLNRDTCVTEPGSACPIMPCDSPCLSFPV